MLKLSWKQLFIFITMGLVAMSCGDNGSDPHDHDHDHAEVDGMELSINEALVYKEFEGGYYVDGAESDISAVISISSSTVDATCLNTSDVACTDSDGNAWDGVDESSCDALDVAEIAAVECTYTEATSAIYDIEVSFLDHDGDVIVHDEDEEEEESLEFVIYENDGSGSLVEVSSSAIISLAVEEHEESGGEDEEHHVGFELTALSPGTSTFVVKLMHGDHADFTSLPVSVTVTD